MEAMVNGIPVHYAEHGTGTPVLALHGGGVDHREIMGALEPLFAGRPGYRRVYPDLPGTGRTPAPETVDGADAVLDTLLVLVDDVIGQERFLVVGHSYGGYLARAIANRRPGQVAGLALICSLAGEQGGGDERPEHVILHAAGDLDVDGALEPAMAAEFRNYLVVPDAGDAAALPGDGGARRGPYRPGRRGADRRAVAAAHGARAGTRLRQPDADPGRTPGRHRRLRRGVAAAGALSARHLCRAGPCRPWAGARAGRAGDRPDGGMAGPRPRGCRRWRDHNHRSGLRSALYLPIFDDLADPAVVARLAAEAEEAGWHGVFVWDHVRWRGAGPAGGRPVDHAGGDRHRHRTAAARSHGHAPGPPPAGQGRQGDRDAGPAQRRPPHPRRRPRQRPLRQASSPRPASNSTTGCAARCSTRRWSPRRRLVWCAGAPPRRALHRRRRPFLPRPVQRPGVPVWTAGFPGNRKPLRRAARHDGFFPVNLDHPDQLAEVVAIITDLRRHATAPYDFAVGLPAGADPAPYAAAGATWWLVEFAPGCALAGPCTRRAPRRPSGTLTLGAALEPFLQVPVAHGRALGRHAADDVQREQPADPVPLEVERDRDLRPGAAGERLDGDLRARPEWLRSMPWQAQFLGGLSSSSGHVAHCGDRYSLKRRITRGEHGRRPAGAGR